MIPAPAATDPFGARQRLPGGGPDFYRLSRIAELGLGDPHQLPVTVRVWLEMLLRHGDGRHAGEAELAALARWGADADADADREFPFFPARVLLQDFTGVPAVADLAAMRSAMVRAGGDPARVDPRVPADLVIDHSVQVDAFGSAQAYGINLDREYQRNGERYALLRWAQQAFHGFRVVPPGMGIVHQVNLEYLAQVVQLRRGPDGPTAIPDTLVGTDSHTTMVNGLGVLGWGVGGIEAEAAMLGQPLSLTRPQVVGVRFQGALRPGVTATDLVLRVTEWLRAHGVVGRFVEFCGAGLSSLSLADRATLANMSPEYGATAALFPVDAAVLEYLRVTGRSPEQVDLVERYTKAQGLFRTDQSPTPRFSELLELDLDGVEPSVAGPRRPQDRVTLDRTWESFRAVFPARATEPEPAGAAAGGPPAGPEDGAVVIAAITSCTNTSNPSVMVAAGLLAQRAVARGLRPPAYVKTSLAPGSRVVSDYLERAGLAAPLAALGFDVVGYGCTTCIGNSGPLPETVSSEIRARELAVVAVLSGNRNFEGRIHPEVRASYLASPPLVVAYALAGTIRRDLTREPLGVDRDGRPVLLSELWPAPEEVRAVVAEAVRAEFFEREYARIFDGDERWRAMDAPTGPLYQWREDSTYIREPPFLADGERPAAPVSDIEGARCLALLGDSVTTDHISPAGAIAPAGPAGQWLQAQGVEPRDFNSYGSRRGNHEVMVRGTLANVRLRNRLAGEREGGFTEHLPDRAPCTIHEAAERYRLEGTPLLLIAGREYGSGSSRDWAAKGTSLLGVRAVVAESYERIHRSNLIGMGVLPLQFRAGESAASLGLSGREAYAVRGLAAGLRPRAEVLLEVRDDDGGVRQIPLLVRLDSQTEAEYYREGGVLPMVLRELLRA